jgi:polygalacturonase
VYQNKNTFALSGTTVTFSEAPPLNAAIEIVYPTNTDTLNGSDASAITYNQGGTGAQDRTVKAKLQETVSVKDFGAVGDGVTDDTAAFNAAWAATDPQAVYVPAASYAITGTVTGKFFSFGGATVVGGTVTTITNLVP